MFPQNVFRTTQFIVYVVHMLTKICKVWIYEQWHINFASEKLRNRIMENTLARMTKFFMQHSTYSNDDKVKHTIKLLLLVYKDQYMLS